MLRYPRAARWGSAILLILVALILAFAAAEAGLRFSAEALNAPQQPCMQPIHAQVHHRYRAFCHSDLTGFSGPVAYDFNESGLRDRKRLLMQQPNRIAVIGDSTVKGLYLRSEDTLPKTLEALYGRQLKADFVNMGIRFSSPTLHAALLRLTHQDYGFRAVVWLMNGTDPMEERFFQNFVKRRDENGMPAEFDMAEMVPLVSNWLSFIRSHLRVNSAVVDFLLRLKVTRAWKTRAEATPFSDEVLCGAIRSVAKFSKAAKVPVLAVFTPHPREGLERGWLGEKYDPSRLAAMRDCAAEAGLKTLDLTGEELPAAQYFPDQLHFRKDGIDWLARRLHDDIFGLLNKR